MDPHTFLPCCFGITLFFFPVWKLYADGELLGGLDIMKEMKEAGELAAALRPQA